MKSPLGALGANPRSAETVLLIHSLVYFLLLTPGCHALVEGLYCGVENCYDVLGVDRDSNRGAISKAYRSLARKHHPDMFKDPTEKEENALIFQKVANAYEILKDEESRTDYDYMLDNPDEMYRHYYRYYKRRVSPKVDVRIVIAVTITLISIAQYYGAWQRYNEAIDYLARNPKYRLAALDVAKNEGMVDTTKKRGKERKDKATLREEEEALIKNVIENKMDIKGAHSKPTMYDVLWVQMVFFPVTLVKYIVWWVSWIWKFNIKKEEYGIEEQIHLMCKNMSMKRSAWDSLEDDVQEDYIRRQLWMKPNWLEFKREQEEAARIKMAESNRHKQYRRYMKNHGPGRMTFED